MSLKRKVKVTESFSMASMTDVIFLLLIFFLVTSTVIVPNAIKVSLPQASAQPSSEVPSVRIVVTESGALYLGLDKAPELELTPLELEANLSEWATTHPESYVAIHADESVSYREVVSAVNLASKCNLRVVLATRIAEGEARR